MKAPKFPSNEEEARRNRSKPKLLTKQEWQELEETRKQKDRDKHKTTDKNRKRPLTIAFRVSESDRARIFNKIALSGLSRQEFMTKAILGAPIKIVATQSIIEQCKTELVQITKRLELLNSFADLDEVNRELLVLILEICRAAIQP